MASEQDCRVDVTVKPDEGVGLIGDTTFCLCCGRSVEAHPWSCPCGGDALRFYPEEARREFAGFARLYVYRSPRTSDRYLATRCVCCRMEVYAETADRTDALIQFLRSGWAFACATTENPKGGMLCPSCSRGHGRMEERSFTSKTDNAWRPSASEVPPGGWGEFDEVAERLVYRSERTSERYLAVKCVKCDVECYVQVMCIDKPQALRRVLRAGWLFYDGGLICASCVGWQPSESELQEASPEFVEKLRQTEARGGSLARVWGKAHTIPDCSVQHPSPAEGESPPPDAAYILSLCGRMTTPELRRVLEGVREMLYDRERGK